MAPSSLHLLGNFLATLLSLPLKFYNLIMATTITIYDGGLKLVTDSLQLWKLEVIIPATLLAAIYLLTHTPGVYDGIYPLPPFIYYS